MLKVGIRAHDVTSSNIFDLALKVEQKGFKYIQFVLKKALKEDDGLLNNDKALHFKKVLNEHNIEVAMLGAYFNPVHSNKEKVKEAVDKFKNHLEYASLIGTKYVGSETGSYNDDKWTYNVKNHTEEAYQEVFKVFNELKETAEDFNVNVNIEGAYHHCMGTPQMLNRLVRELNSDNVTVIVDLYNYLYIGNHEQRNKIFEDAINLMKDKIVLFHLKDYIVDGDKLKQVGLGQGLMDYPFMIKLIKTHCPNAFLIFEGVTGDDIDSSLEYINRLLNE